SFYHPPPTTDISTLPLHDALPISPASSPGRRTTASTSTIICAPSGPSSAPPPAAPPSPTSAARPWLACRSICPRPRSNARFRARSEEHTSELQSRENLVCRLLLEK